MFVDRKREARNLPVLLVAAVLALSPSFLPSEGASLRSPDRSYRA